MPAPGIPPLRQAVAAFLERTGRMRVAPDRVVVTPGAKPIMFFTILALAGEGDEVLYPDPGFPMYSSITSFTGRYRFLSRCASATGSASTPRSSSG